MWKQLITDYKDKIRNLVNDIFFVEKLVPQSFINWANAKAKNYHD